MSVMKFSTYEAFVGFIELDLEVFAGFSSNEALAPLKCISSFPCGMVLGVIKRLRRGHEALLGLELLIVSLLRQL